MCETRNMLYATYKPEDDPLSAARDCLFNMFAAWGRLIHLQIEQKLCCGDKEPT